MLSAISPYSGYNPYGISYANRALQNQAAGQAQSVAQATVLRGIGKPAQPEVPVQPVTPARLVSAQEDPAQQALLRYNSDPAAMAVRMRIQYPDDAAQAGEAAVEPETEAQETKSAQEVMEESECQTCKERKYQDGSDDAGVSFKTPTRIDPDQVASAVRGHENEHVVREQAKAKREGREVVSQSVSIHTDICPECGKVYVSGGTTRTVTRAADSQSSQNQNQKKQQTPFDAVA